MKLNRRDFLKLSGGSAVGLTLLDVPAVDTAGDRAQQIPLKNKIGDKLTICPYCSVGCGIRVAVEDGKVVNAEGDPDNPINQGALCSKGNAIVQIANSDRRLKKVLYRAPGTSQWEEKDWNWALEQIAQRVKRTRDANWVSKDKDGYLVNRTDAIASLGGSAQNNEECYLITKMSRALGLVWLEHEARLCHSSTVAALGEAFGRGAMTNHWNDLANSDCIMIIGSNAAQQHPIAFQWVTKAIDKGATLIVVDPRFTQSAAKAHIYAPMRSGTDVAFIGGMIKYVLDNMETSPQDFNMEYVREYTNASILVNPNYSFRDGLFSGYDATKRSFDKSTWQYQLDEKGIPRRDSSLKDPQSVFQLLRRHYSRYDADTVSRTTGTPKETFLKVCQAFAATGKRGKVGTIMYSMGTTQHTNGSQMIRAYSILQLLLGNIGLAGGGINAMRGESNVQGSTDQAILFHLLPGYLKAPQNVNDSLAKYLTVNTPVSKDPMSVNWWQNYPKYFVSLLKAWWGNAATKENEFAYQYLPKSSTNNSWIAIFEAMDIGTIKGLLIWGMNPAVSSPDLNVCRRALGKLDWMVVADLWETETATFWKRPGVNPADIKTEVFLLPAAASMEKEGSLSNSGRLVQWRYRCSEPPGEAKSDLEMVNQLLL
ncbi:MAG: fdnG, partial [Dehalococcoidia bacterium]|nr:fdnG [Dehalococcoidia bacterium]